MHTRASLPAIGLRSLPLRRRLLLLLPLPLTMLVAIAGVTPARGWPSESFQAAAVTAAPMESVPRDAASQDALSEDAASQGAVSQGAASQGAASQGAVSQGAVSQGAVSQGAVSQGAVSQDAVSQDAVSQDAVPKEVASPIEARPGGPLDYAEARATLKEVLVRREFQQQDESRWAEALRQRMTDWVRWLLSRLAASPVSATTLGRVLAWTVAIAALLLAGTWLFRGRRAIDRVAQSATFALPRLTSQEWAARARAALAAGDAKEALRCAYHAVLFRLEEQGVWRVDDSRTPREYVSLLKAQDARRAAFADLTRDFERTWYGSQVARVDDLAARLEVLGCPVPAEPTI